MDPDCLYRQHMADWHFSQKNGFYGVHCMLKFGGPYNKYLLKHLDSLQKEIRDPDSLVCASCTIYIFSFLHLRSSTRYLHVEKFQNVFPAAAQWF